MEKFWKEIVVVSHSAEKERKKIVLKNYEKFG
jgi:hypothetical protein